MSDGGGKIFLNNLKGTMKTLRALTVCSAALLLAQIQSPAQSLLDLYAQPGMPDLSGSQLSASYDAGSGAFSVAGAASGYSTPSGDVLGVSGSLTDFSLNAVVNSGWDLLSSGTFSAYGNVDGSAGPDTLLTGNLVAGGQGGAFDYASYYPDLFQFAFNFTVTGGSLANDFGGVNSQSVIELYLWYPSFADLSGSFSNSESINAADVFPNPVPEPSTAALILICGAAWSVARRCSR
jgi:hypothetical protein